MDTEQFRAPPITTGGLLAHYREYGRRYDDHEFELVHFLELSDLRGWLDEQWKTAVRPRAEAAAEAGLAPVFGFSCYTWNVAEFLELAKLVKTAVPEAVIIAGGPHVQRPQDFLFDEAVDIVVMGEGEETFTQWLDSGRERWPDLPGLAFVVDGELVRTPERIRQKQLDRLPSALGVVPLRDEAGRELYQQASYETARGCPYKCAFCEWGTGAVGTKMYQFSLDRVRSDLETLVAGGIRDIWLADSNFGALREDEAKAEIVVELRRKFGLPNTLATSWSKYHSPRVQSIVRTLHRNGLLSHYHLALQTLTPEALELSNRKNMKANDYEPIVKAMAAEGIPIAAELIWGLPGDDLVRFERNLDHLLSIFPNVNIFGYTLLPGTEFFERREELGIRAVPVAGYGKAKGEYVVGCNSFTEDEGEEGYLLSTAYIFLARGQFIPLTARYLALRGRVPVAAMLRYVLRELLAVFDVRIGRGREEFSRMDVYEQRSELWVRVMKDRPKAYRAITAAVGEWLGRHDAEDLRESTERVLAIDAAQCPRTGGPSSEPVSFEFRADLVRAALSEMELPRQDDLCESEPTGLQVQHSGGVGELCMDPDGGEWVRGRLCARVSGTADADAAERLDPGLF